MLIDAQVRDDLALLEDGTESALDWQPVLTRDADMTMAIWSCPQPTIAVVQGYCLAGGCEVAIACDMIVASDDACLVSPRSDTDPAR